MKTKIFILLVCSSTILILSGCNTATVVYDIRGTWTLILDWTYDDMFDATWTITYTGSLTAGTFYAVESYFGHEWAGTYTVSGADVHFQDQDQQDNGSITYATICIGSFSTINTMSGSFTNGPDPGTWTATR